MNKEKILKLADFIENHPYKTLGFNMINWLSRIHADLSGRECGTTACLGGWAVVMEHSIKRLKEVQGDPDLTVAYEARSILGLNIYQGCELFERHYGCEITDKGAVKVLRHFAKTGNIDFYKFTK